MALAALTTHQALVDTTTWGDATWQRLSTCLRHRAANPRLHLLLACMPPTCKGLLCRQPSGLGCRCRYPGSPAVGGGAQTAAQTHQTWPPPEQASAGHTATRQCGQSSNSRVTPKQQFNLNQFLNQCITCAAAPPERVALALCRPQSGRTQR